MRSALNEYSIYMLTRGSILSAGNGAQDVRRSPECRDGAEGLKHWLRSGYRECSIISALRCADLFK